MLPANYRWLTSLSPLPRMVDEALKLYGTIEMPGDADSPVILAWAKEVGLEKTYSHDSIPWCGLFMALVAKRAGKLVPDQPLWALNWANFGRALVGLEMPSLGDVLTFKRKLPNGGTAGHVALYIGEDTGAYHTLGGNQSDKVCITRMAKDRLHKVRRPVYRVPPATVKPYQLASAGAFSANEA